MASPAPAAPAPGGRKILGLRPRTAAIAAVVVLGGALAYFWWRRKNSSSSAASSSTSSASAYTDAAQLDELQAELAQYLEDQNQGSGGGGSTGSSTGTTTGTTTGTGTGTTGPGTGTVGPGGVSTKPPPTKVTTPARTPAPAMPGNVRSTKVTADSVGLSWTKAANATSYRVRVTYQGKLVGGAHTTSATSITVSGLTADHTYTFHVASIGPGGTSAETNGPAVKTSR